VEFQVLPSWAKKEKWKTNTFIDLVVHEERPNAVRVSAKGIVPDQSNCWFCNKPLATIESQALGVGPVCAKTIGIPKKVNAETVSNWYDANARLDNVWMPRRVIKFPHHLRMATPSENEVNIIYGSWGEAAKCEGNLTIGYSPTSIRKSYEGLICLEIFCEMSVGFQSQVLSLEGAEWRGGSRDIPSWRNARDIGKDKLWTIPFSPAAASEIFEICSEWNVSLEVDEKLVNLVQARHKSKQSRSAIVDGIGVDTVEQIKKMTPDQLDKIDWDMIVCTEPWSHQKAAIAFVAAQMNLSLPIISERKN